MALSSVNEVQGEFNPKKHVIEIKTGQGNKEYLPVQWRLVWFRSLCPEGSIETEMLHLDWNTEFSEEAWEWNSQIRKSEKVRKVAPGVAVFRAVVKDGQGGVATGTKSEKGVSFPDFIEKAETGAIGRALAALGYGTQFTGDEMQEGQRFADSPTNKQDETPEQPQKQKFELTPEYLKAEWAKVYKIAPDQIAERWPKFIAWVLGEAIADQDLDKIQMSKLNGRIEQQRRATRTA